jgi:hypothetical protein
LVRGLRALVAGLSDLEALLLARDGRGSGVARARQQRDVGGELGELGLDRAQPLVEARERVAVAGLEVGEPLVEAVDAVLDALEALRDRAQPAREALDVGRGRDVQRAHGGFLRLRGLLARPRRRG